MKKCNTLCKGMLLACAFFFHFSSLSALEYYWVGGSGLWSDHNNHWATTSGGAVFHDQVPTSMDNVHFDANSFPAGGTVTIDQTIIYCMDMDWTGAGNMPVLAGPGDKQVWIYGSLKLVAGMQWNVAGEVHFRAFQTGKTIISAGQEFLSTVFFDGTGGSWTLLDSFKIYDNGDLIQIAGSLYTNGQDLTVGRFFNSYAPSTLHLSSSNLYIGRNCCNSAQFSIGLYPVDFDAGTSTIHMKSSPNNQYSCFGGNSLNYYNLVGDGPIYVQGDNNFHSATFLKSAKIYGNNIFESLIVPIARQLQMKCNHLR